MFHESYVWRLHAEHDTQHNDNQHNRVIDTFKLADNSKLDFYRFVQGNIIYHMMSIWMSWHRFNLNMLLNILDVEASNQYILFLVLI